VALVLTGAWLSGGGAGAGAITSTGVRTVVVAPGDSLWSIAATDYPGQDIRERVAEIIARNSLGSAPIQPGEVLHLPA
jgi:LysM repeat protein